MYGAGEVRIEDVPDATVIEPIDAVVRVTRACICGSDLWPYRTLEHSETGRVMGHEAIGIVGLHEVPDGYRAMNDREAIKVMVKP
jgi:hypothetical protein